MNLELGMTCPRCQSPRIWRAIWTAKSKCDNCDFEVTDKELQSYEGIFIQMGEVEMTVEPCFCPAYYDLPHLHPNEGDVISWDEALQKSRDAPSNRILERWPKK